MPPSETIQSALVNAIQTLSRAQITSPRLDAEVLLAHTLRCDRSRLYAHPRAPLPAEASRTFSAFIRRRAAHEPVAHLLGEREFFGLPFFVSPAVLIPRPETELLVEHVLARVSPSARIVDVGTGSGCIAVSLAVQLPSARLFATDISAAALAVARKNIARHNVEARVSPVQADLLTGLRGQFDAIVSNPPYIAPAERSTLPPDVREFEPPQALFSENEGLAHLIRLLKDVPSLLSPGGMVFLEFGAAQGAAVLSAAKQMHPAASFSIVQDLGGRDRLLVGAF